MIEQRMKWGFAVLFAVIFLDMLGLGIIIPLLPAYATQLGATALWVGIIFAGHSLSRIVILPLVGRSSDRRGRKKPYITVGIALYVLLALCYVKASSVYELTVIRLIQGVASAMIFPIALAYIGEMAPKNKEGAYMGTFSMSIFVGMGCGPFLGGLIKDLLGMAWVFYSMAILSGISLILIIFLLPEQKTRSRGSIDKVISYKNLLRLRPIQGILIYRIVNAFIRGGTLAFLPLYAAQLRMSALDIGTLLSTNTILVGLLQRPFGRLADRHSKLFLIIAGSLIAAGTLFFVPLAPDFGTLFLLTTLMGMGSALSMPAASAIAVKIGKTEGISSTMGLFTMAMSIGMVVAPISSGAIMDFSGINAAFWFMGTIALVGTVLFYHRIKDHAKTGRF